MTEPFSFPAAEPPRPLGLYLHIPFCKRKCLYCDFLSAPADQETIDRYVDAVCAQLSREAANYRTYQVETVFFGGGTPSLLSAGQLDRIMERIRSDYALSKQAEISLESNPGTLTADRLSGYRKAGINRLSIGLQSASDAELRELGRIHDYSAFLENYRQARRAGFDNINVDLMSALPGQTTKGWLDTLKRTADLGPEHISAYSLMIEEGTPFGERYGKRPDPAGFLPLPDEEEERLMYEQTECLLQEYGYRRYEISNYARPGFLCRHNVGYWTRRPYLGIGLGSASFVDNVRWKMTEDLTVYLDHYAPGAAAKGAPSSFDERLLYQEIQVLDKTEQMEEFLILGLRLRDGISLGEFRRQFQVGLREVYGPVLDRLLRQGLLLFYEDGKKMRLTKKGTDLSNYVLAQF